MYNKLRERKKKGSPICNRLRNRDKTNQPKKLEK
jgi:hypothetical protein